MLTLSNDSYFNRKKTIAKFVKGYFDFFIASCNYGEYNHV